MRVSWEALYMEAAAAKVEAPVPPEKLCADYILPTAFDRGVADIVAKAVADEAVRLGINRV